MPVIARAHVQPQELSSTGIRILVIHYYCSTIPVHPGNCTLHTMYSNRLTLVVGLKPCPHFGWPWRTWDCSRSSRLEATQRAGICCQAREYHNTQHVHRKSADRNRTHHNNSNAGTGKAGRGVRIRNRASWAIHQDMDISTQCKNDTLNVEHGISCALV